MKDINLRLREIRRARNLSQEQLAEQLGISRQAIIALEQGASLPSLPVLLALMRVLDLPFPRLFGDEWQPFKKFSDTVDDSTHLAWQTPREQTVRLLLTENDDALHVKADLPGIREDDITIDLSQQHVLIMATRKHKPIDGVTIHVNEIDSGPVARILSLPCPINTEKANAKFENGVLELTLPKFLPVTKRRITFTHSRKEKE